MENTKLEIPILKQMLNPTIQFISLAIINDEIDPIQKQEFLENSFDVLNRIIDQNHEASKSSRFKDARVFIEIQRTHSSLQLNFTNSGQPVFQSDFDTDQLQFKNAGRLGQKVTLNIPLNNPDPVKTKPIEKHSNETTEIRELQNGEEFELSRLFYNVYRYRYINEYVYYPEKLQQMIHEGKLRSFIGLVDGKICGHVGLLSWNNTPKVYEAALGVVNPEYKNNGLFGKIFKYVHDLKATLPHDYCIYDFVTNHEFSQKLVAKYGYTDMALALGCQVRDTQARLSELGIGEDDDSYDRYSLLIAIATSSSKPFGNEITLPPQIGESTDFILKAIGLKWIPSPRFDLLPKNGNFSLQTSTEQKAAHFDFFLPGLSSIQQIITSTKDLIRNGTQYVSIDFPVRSAGLGQFYDLLALEGFFLAGYVPYRHSDQLALRLQYLAPTKVNFQKIKMFSKAGITILNMVKADYERNNIL